MSRDVFLRAHVETLLSLRGIPVQTYRELKVKHIIRAELEHLCDSDGTAVSGTFCDASSRLD